MIQTQWNTDYHKPCYTPRTYASQRDMSKATAKDADYIAAIEAGIDTSVKLVAHFGVSIQNVMKHLRKLKALDVVEGSKRTRKSGGVENVWRLK